MNNNINVNINWMDKDSESAVVALATVEIEGLMTLYSVRVIKGPKGVFVSFPSSKGKDGKYYTYYHFEDDIYKDVTEAVLEMYKSLAGETKKSYRRK